MWKKWWKWLWQMMSVPVAAAVEVVRRTSGVAIAGGYC